jgi:glycosyltransferase involved in cell wall biosynthesis
VLLIAEAANPEWASVPLIGWRLSRAIAELTDAHLVTQVRNREAILRAGLPEASFTALDSETVARPLFRAADWLRGPRDASGGGGVGHTLLTASGALAYYWFEELAWRAFGSRLRAREFDLVHRITPLSPTVPSLLAARCARLGVPFLVGPLNGGIPWPRGFESVRRREREWLSYVRGLYKALPGHRSMRKHAAAILVGSIDTRNQLPAPAQAKCVYVPENAIEPGLFPDPPPQQMNPPLRVAFVGRLVPYKGADILLEAAAPLVAAGKAEVEVIGDGPEMQALRALAAGKRLEAGVRFSGWVAQHEVGARLRGAHVFAFPSVREFGGGAVLEAMAAGLAPVVVGYGGPAEIVTPRTGIAIPIGSRAELVEGFRRTLEALAGDPARVRSLGRSARERVLKSFTWRAKAAQIHETYRWVLGQRDKPDFGMPLPD